MVQKEDDAGPKEVEEDLETLAAEDSERAEHGIATASKRIYDDLHTKKTNVKAVGGDWA